jgi:hypothetical protein
MWPFFQKQNKPEALVEYNFGKIYFNRSLQCWDVSHNFGDFDFVVQGNRIPESIKDNVEFLQALIKTECKSCISTLEKDWNDFMPYSLSCVSISIDENVTYELEFSSDKWPDAGWEFIFDATGKLIEHRMGD